MTETKLTPRRSPAVVFFRTFGIALVILCLIHAALLAFRPKVYFSEAVVEFGASQTESTGSLQPSVFTEIRVMSSPELRKRVVEELHLDEVWGKKFNNGPPLPLSDSLKMLDSRSDVRALRGAPIITIRVYGDLPAETARIANSIAENYRDAFTESRHVSARILKLAQPSGMITHAGLISEIPKAIFRSLFFASLAATIALGIALFRNRLARIPPPIPGTEKTSRRFEKY